MVACTVQMHHSIIYIYCINLSPTYFCHELFQLSAFISDQLYGSYESEPSPSIPEAESPHSDKPDPDAEDCDSESSEGTMAASQCGCGSCEHGPGDPHQTCNGAHYLCYKCSAYVPILDSPRGGLP